MKKGFLRLLLLICGLNVFTACYGMPPGGWEDELPDQEQEESNTPAENTEEESADDTEVDQ